MPGWLWLWLWLCVQMNELQARDLRAWCPLMHAAWSGSAEVFRAVVVAIEDNLGRDQVLYCTVPVLCKCIILHLVVACCDVLVLVLLRCFRFV